MKARKMEIIKTNGLRLRASENCMCIQGCVERQSCEGEETRKNRHCKKISMSSAIEKDWSNVLHSNKYS
jgi:hypothetical protein